MSQIFHHDLANGLHIIGEPSQFQRSCGIGFFVRTGARDETHKESGVSHFLEHMVFKGTQTRGALDITFQLGNIGAQSNAYTSEENTVFYGSVIPEYFSQMQELLSDMMRPALDSDEFRMEKKVILEEIALYEDRPQFYFFEKAFAEYFGDHPCGHSVLGTTASIEALDRDEMKTYFDRRYSASNITLVATGRFSWEQFLKDTQAHCGDWPSFLVERKLSPYSTKPREVVLRWKNTTQAHMLLVTNGPSAQDEDRYPFAVLSSILGDSAGSKLYWELVHTGIADTAVTDLDERDGAGCFLSYAVCNVGALETVKEKVRKVLSTPTEFSEEDCERAKQKLLSRVVLSGETPMGRLMSLGNSWNYRKETLPLTSIIERIRSITKRDLLQSLERYPINNWCEYVMLPQ